MIIVVVVSLSAAEELLVAFSWLTVLPRQYLEKIRSGVLVGGQGSRWYVCVRSRGLKGLGQGSHLVSHPCGWAEPGTLVQSEWGKIRKDFLLFHLVLLFVLRPAFDLGALLRKSFLSFSSIASHRIMGAENRSHDFSNSASQWDQERAMPVVFQLRALNKAWNDVPSFQKFLKFLVNCFFPLSSPGDWLESIETMCGL